MIIIVEGPDGAGKSELIQQLLASHPGSTTRHFGAPITDEQAREYWKVYMDAINATDPNKLTLFDRCWYSDLVYGPIMRGKTEMDLKHVELLEALVYYQGGGHVIYCTADIKTLWKRCRTRGEYYVKTKEQLSAIAQSYSDVFANVCTLPVIKYDTTY